MFEEFSGKKVRIHLVSYANQMYSTYMVEGKILQSTEKTTKVEVEEKKKFGENKKYIQIINNGFIVFVEESI